MEILARIIARIVVKPMIRDWLIAVAQRTPDEHIMSPDRQQVYMYRYWLFNEIDRKTHKRKYWFIPFSLRIHHIVMPDLDRHLHDHPFNARTWVLRGGYEEIRPAESTLIDPNWNRDKLVEYQRLRGDTTTLGFEKFHKISYLYGGEAWTLFAFGRYIGPWGFLVAGRKLTRREYECQFKCGKPCDLAECVCTEIGPPQKRRSTDVVSDGQFFDTTLGEPWHECESLRDAVVAKPEPVIRTDVV